MVLCVQLMQKRSRHSRSGGITFPSPFLITSGIRTQAWSSSEAEITDSQGAHAQYNPSDNSHHQSHLFYFTYLLRSTLRALYVGTTLKNSLEQCHDPISTKYRCCANVRCPLGMVSRSPFQLLNYYNY